MKIKLEKLLIDKSRILCGESYGEAKIDSFYPYTEERRQLRFRIEHGNTIEGTWVPVGHPTRHVLTDEDWPGGLDYFYEVFKKITYHEDDQDDQTFKEAGSVLYKWLI